MISAFHLFTKFGLPGSFNLARSEVRIFTERAKPSSMAARSFHTCGIRPGGPDMSIVLLDCRVRGVMASDQLCYSEKPVMRDNRETAPLQNAFVVC
jgi:hypothetical protein